MFLQFNLRTYRAFRNLLKIFDIPMLLYRTGKYIPRKIIRNAIVEINNLRTLSRATTRQKYYRKNIVSPYEHFVII